FDGRRCGLRLVVGLLNGAWKRLCRDPGNSNSRLRSGGLLYRVHSCDSRSIRLRADEGLPDGARWADVRCLALFSLFAGFRLARLLSVLSFLGRADIPAGWIAPGVSRGSLKLREAAFSAKSK